MAGRDSRNNFRRPDGTIRREFDGGAGRYGLVLSTGRDGKGIFLYGTGR